VDEVVFGRYRMVAVIGERGIGKVDKDHDKQSTRLLIHGYVKSTAAPNCGAWLCGAPRPRSANRVCQGGQGVIPRRQHRAGEFLTVYSPSRHCLPWRAKNAPRRLRQRCHASNNR
jgi:hypothetical protein